MILFFRYGDEPRRGSRMYFADYLPPPKIKYIGKSPVPIDPKDVIITNDVDINGLVSPPFSSVVSIMQHRVITFVKYRNLSILTMYVAKKKPP